MSPYASFLILVIVVAIPGSVAAQPQQPFPFSDPQQMFEQFFGAAPQEDRAEIGKITIARRKEAEIGERASREYLAKLRRGGTKVLSRGKQVEYLRSLVAQVQPKMKNAERYQRIRVYIADSAETDARSFPGGTLIFYRGMLEFAENEAALVGVVGHELSHLDHGHQLYDAKRAKLMQSTFSGGDGFSPDKFLRNGAMLMRSFSKPFRPEDESQADEDGATWTYELGYDPREMAKLFLRMHERDRGAKPNVPSFMRTHPYHLDRFETISEQYDQLQTDDPKEDLYIGTKNLINRVPRTVREF
jgi:predicted Zn-dependent protease